MTSSRPSSSTSDDLVAVHGEAKAIELANQAPKNSPIPWHPGAMKYFTEKGVKM